ncbi:hypothetical protein GCM10010172_28050 [Paractinoplanes ferrugineus]|uniref:Uncharacterized protein n=1 Tax=Paractinoplanes ferrugineus TaxID=113564 RepID=A0A919ITL5_9ACTN|nr:DUF6023 family protein [Actinoplanes ferrugineus]GIE08285.1 hypothetical protein Afe05nite_01250 [Actinoplanes ferrugineus]
MTGERARGVVLYLSAAVLLAGGALWWFRTAPNDEIDPRIEQWSQAALRLLPDTDEQETAATLPLGAGVDREVEANLENGSYLVRILCVGGPDSQVRVRLGQEGSDSGRGLSCDRTTEPDSFTVGTAGQLRMTLTVGPAGPVVLRYALQRQNTP